MSPSSSIMFARSTACRHGEGRTSANATSMISAWSPRTSTFADFTSRWARPASHKLRTIRSDVSMIRWSTSTSPISVVPSRNSVSRMYSRSGVISTNPYVRATPIPASRITRSM